MSSGKTPTDIVHSQKQTASSAYASLWHGVSFDRAIQEQALALVNHAFTLADATQPSFPLIYVNKAFCALTGHTPEELLGQSCNILQGPETARQSVEAVKRALGTGQPCVITLENYRKDGSLFWNELNLTPLRNEQGQVTHYVGIQRDVTALVEAQQCFQETKDDLKRATLEIERVTLELERANAKYYHDALHDALTGLANRSLLYNRLEHLLERDKRQPGNFALLYLDLDGFKHVNDSLGHMVGDKLLIAVAERLKTCVRPADTVARLGGDEFVILLEGLEPDSSNRNSSNPNNLNPDSLDPSSLNPSEEATLVAERVQKTLEGSFVIHAHTLHVSSSIGIALHTAGYNHSADVLRDADAAMYNAKQSGKNQVVIFEPTMRSGAGTLEVDLRGALNNGELSVYYQPIFSTQTRTLIGFEALVRWHHKTRGELLPDAFIPLAEETGLIVAIDRFVLREGCKQVKVWQELGQPFTLNVNLSGYQLFRQDLVPYLKNVLEETGFDATCLRLELTETVMMNLGQAVQKRLQDLCDLGVQLYIDDFGKGYSSLGYLQDLPSKTLKIDRSFTERIDKGFEGAELVRTIVIMARNLGLSVVVEGIESQNQLELVSTLGCEFVQGNFFSPPLAARDIERFVFEAETINLTTKSALQTKE